MKKRIFFVCIFFIHVFFVPQDIRAASFEIMPSAQVFVASPGARISSQVTIKNGEDAGYYQLNAAVLPKNSVYIDYKNNLEKKVFLMNPKETKEIAYTIQIAEKLQSTAEFTVETSVKAVRTHISKEKYSLTLEPTAISRTLILVNNGYVPSPKIKVLNAGIVTHEDTYIQYKVENQSSNSVPISSIASTYGDSTEQYHLSAILPPTNVSILKFGPLNNPGHIDTFIINTELLNNKEGFSMSTKRYVRNGWLSNLSKYLGKLLQPN